MQLSAGITRKQLIVLFLCSLAILMWAQSLLRLLPVHVSQMGANPSLTANPLPAEVMDAWTRTSKTSSTV